MMRSGFISAGNLNPYKARIVLILGLAIHMSSVEQLQTLF